MHIKNGKGNSYNVVLDVSYFISSLKISTDSGKISHNPILKNIPAENAFDIPKILMF